MTKIVEKETGAVKVVDMSMFEADAGKGMGEIGLADLSVSYLVLLSGGGDLDAAKAVNEAANKGDFFNKGTGTVYKGSDGIDVIPCAYQRRFVQWTPLGAGSKAPIASFTQHEQRPETSKSKEEQEDYNKQKHIDDCNKRERERIYQEEKLYREQQTRSVLEMEAVRMEASVHATMKHRIKSYNKTFGTSYGDLDSMVAGFKNDVKRNRAHKDKLRRQKEKDNHKAQKAIKYFEEEYPD